MVNLAPDADDLSLFADQCRAIIEGARDIVLFMDVDGRLTYVNDAAVQAYGWTLDELLTMNVRDLRSTRTKSDVHGQMQRAGEDGVLFETVHVRKDGTEFPVEVSSRGITVAGRSALVSIVRDVSLRRTREAERDRLVRELEQANARLDALFRVVGGTVGALEIDELLNNVVRALADVTAADTTMVLLRDGDRLVVRAEEGSDARIGVGFSVGPGEGFAGRVALTKRPLYVRDVLETDVVIDAHREAGLRTMFGVPMLLGNDLIGVVECGWVTTVPVSDAEQVMLQIAADRVSVAVAGAQRYELTRRAERLNASLHEVTGLLNSSFDLDQTMPMALGISAHMIGCEAAAFGEFTGGRWDVRYAHRVEMGSLDEVPFHKRALGRPTEIGTPVVEILPDSVPGRWLEENYGFKEGIVVPVAVRREWFGALLFGRDVPRGGFNDAEKDFVRRLASSVQLAYTNYTEREAEHHIAETLQEALLQVPDRVDGVRYGRLYRSASVAARVGGDFFDVFELPAGKVGVVIGDVSGKGLDAAVLTSVIKDTVRAYAQEMSSPAQTIAKANEVLRRAARLPDFASLVFVVVDPFTGRSDYCCAGHPPGIVVRADSTVEMLECRSPVIGAFSGLDYFDSTFELGIGDRLVLYTDGLTEARTREGEFFGDDRLLEAVAQVAHLDVNELPAALVELVERFAGGRLTDDSAVFAIRRDVAVSAGDES